jgi:hypothetical protein
MYEYKRTCTRCQTDRYVPADIAERKPTKQAKAVGWATPIVGKKRQQIRADQAMVNFENQQATEAARCPQCGSASYNEEQIPV